MVQQYEALISEYTRRLERTSRRFHWLGYGKLLLIAALGFALYRLWAGSGRPAAIGAAALFLCLAVLWVVHVRVHREMDECRAVAEVGRQYLERIAGRWDFADGGAEFAEPEHPYCDDLDILGEGSLFQMLGVAHSFHGRRRLAADLLGPRYGADEIAQRQCAVDELGEDVEFAALLECDAAKTGGDRAVLGVLQSLRAPVRGLSPLAERLLLWLPPLISALFVLAMAFGGTGARILALGLLGAQGVFWAAGYARTGRLLGEAVTAPHTFGHYAAAMKRVAGREFHSPLLAGLRAQLTGQDGAIAAVRRLDTIVGWIRLRHSGLPYFLANVFLLWDYRCAVALARWKRAYGARCEGWFEALGEIESLLSLSVLGNVCEGACLPETVPEPGVLRAKSLGHPLIPGPARVCNDIELEGGLLLISGSNMSGKTTFLRTVGVNLVLARAGGRVCAAAMRCSLFHLRTSLRIADSLGEGVSTFYAELRQIAAIIREARERDDLFFLIDELFRGTNSEDRLFGARAVIEELARLPARGLITTHDLALCELERTHPSVRNHSFSERYEDGEMLFDYRMRPGKARSTNARFLMRKVGIL